MREHIAGVIHSATILDVKHELSDGTIHFSVSRTHDKESQGTVIQKSNPQAALAEVGDILLLFRGGFLVITEPVYNTLFNR